MRSETVALKPNTASASIPIDHPALLEHMEATQSKVAPYLPSNTDITANYLQGIPSDIQKEAAAIIDKICIEVGHKPLSQRLLEINFRIAQAAEKHIFMKKEKEHEKKGKIEINVQDQKSLKIWQATWLGIGGYVPLFLNALSYSIPQLQFLSHLAPLLPPAVSTANTILDGKLGPLSHESQLFLSLAQSDKQAAEGLKNLPEQLRNLILELMRLELRAIESIAQR